MCSLFCREREASPVLNLLLIVSLYYFILYTREVMGNATTKEIKVISRAPKTITPGEPMQSI